MKVHITTRPTTDEIDGIRLDRYEPGQQYEVSGLTGSVLLAESWAIPIDDWTQPPPEAVVPERSGHAPAASPPNLIREEHRRFLDSWEYVSEPRDCTDER